MKQQHIALIVLPENQEIVAVPWLLEPIEPTHSGFIHEETRIMNHYYEEWKNYEKKFQSAVKCDKTIATEILNKQYPERKIFPHIKVHYNVTDVTLNELMGMPKRDFIKGEKIICVYPSPLPGNEIGPELECGKEYSLRNIIRDSKGYQHFNVGLHSRHGYISSYETGEHLPDGDQIHWCHPSRFIYQR